MDTWEVHNEYFPRVETVGVKILTSNSQQPQKTRADCPNLTTESEEVANIKMLLWIIISEECKSDTKKCP